jgi:hypothetical protein
VRIQSLLMYFPDRLEDVPSLTFSIQSGLKPAVVGSGGINASHHYNRSGATRNPTIVAKGRIAAVAVMPALPRVRLDQSKERCADLQCNVNTATQSLMLRKQKNSCRREHISRSITILCNLQSTGFAGLWSVSEQTVFARLKTWV